MGKRYNYEDAWEDMEDFYGAEDLEAAMTQSKDALIYGEHDPAEYVDNIVLDLTAEDGTVMQYELVGRVDIREKSYLILHRMDAEDASVINVVRAWDDPNGNLCVTEITDKAEAEEVYERVRMLVTDEDESWDDIPGGGVQWDD